MFSTVFIGEAIAAGLVSSVAHPGTLGVLDGQFIPFVLSTRHVPIFSNPNMTLQILSHPYQ